MFEKKTWIWLLLSYEHEPLKLNYEKQEQNNMSNTFTRICPLIGRTDKRKK